MKCLVNFNKSMSVKCRKIQKKLKIDLNVNILERKAIFFDHTRPKPVGHGYGCSMAVGTSGEWFILVPFFVRGRTVDSEGGGGVKYLKINILSWVPGKMNK